MCRVLAYLGDPVSLELALFETDNAHVRGITYSHREMIANLHPLGFGGARVALERNGQLREFARTR